MKNRERLIKTAMYDFICSINANLRPFMTCVITGIIGYDKKIVRCYNYKCRCDECIADWLEEEERTCKK